MLLLAHTGITLGIAWFCQSLWNRRIRARLSLSETLAALEPAVNSSPHSLDPPPSSHRLGSLSLDFRLVLLGSMLPDLMDKPLGIVLFRDIFSSGRIFAHTAIFLLALLLGGISFYFLWGRKWLLTLGYGSLIHLILDEMWQYSATLLWPIYGWGFERFNLSEWLPAVWRSLTHDADVFATEILGAIILTAFLVKLVRQQEVRHFLRSGSLHAKVV